MRYIVAVLYTFSWGGFAVQFDSGRIETLSARQLTNLVGAAGFDRLNAIAHRLAGHWHKLGAADQLPTIR